MIMEYCGKCVFLSNTVQNAKHIIFTAYEIMRFALIMHSLLDTGQSKHS